MRKDNAIHTWFEAFANAKQMSVYPTTSVPKEAKFPYMTYDYITGDILDGDIPITVNQWHYTESEAYPNEVASDFKKYIANNDIILCDEGAIWVKPGIPFAQSLQDDENPYVKRRVINVTLEYLTT